MRILSEHKMGMFPNRLSFGFMGRLDSVGITTENVVVQVREVALTDDCYDRSKLALAGLKSHLDVLNISERGWWEDCHLAAVTRQGSFRTVCCTIEYECQPGLDLNCRLRGANNPEDHGTWAYRGRVIINKLTLYLPMTNFTQGFFILGDKQWDGIVHSVKSLAGNWKERTSILKTTLCP